MSGTPLRPQAEASLRAGVEYLLERQDGEGFWPDYELRAGASHAWTTAWVGWCLAGCAQGPRASQALRRASAAVLTSATPGGWGYNRETGADADSTAWAVNFLAACGYACRPFASDLLPRYVSPAGAVRTFLDPLTGTWSDPHLDVGAIVGLALLNCGARPDLVSRIRTSLLDRVGHDGTWPSFWWASRTYATVWAALLGRRTGGLPQWQVERLRAFAGSSALGDSALERALGLLLVTELGPEPNIGARLAADLLDLQLSRCCWEPSALLLLPPRGVGPAHPVGPHADVNGFVSTAMACLALARWVRASG
jgi:hypothetical protein